MTTVLFSSSPDETASWLAALRDWSARLSIPITLYGDPTEVAPEAVDVLVLNPHDGVQDLAPYADAALIQSIWAGVEAYLANPTLPEGPALCRMVEAGLTEGMTDYICGHVLRHHLDIDRVIRHSAEGVWRKTSTPLSRERRVGILGLGALGRDAAIMLKALRFDVAGWSRTAKSIDGIPCYHGDEGLREIIPRSDILVTILPLTQETRHILNAETLALAPKGAVLINPGRGALIDDAALLAALAEGQIGHATLDVFVTEPLPADHLYWRHPHVTVTPHIAAETRTTYAAEAVIRQIGRLQKGEPLTHIVDHRRGY